MLFTEKCSAFGPDLYICRLSVKREIVELTLHEKIYSQLCTTYFIRYQ